MKLMIRFLAKFCFYALTGLFVFSLVLQRFGLAFLAATAIVTAVAVVSGGNFYTSMGLAFTGCLMVAVIIAFTELS